MESSPGVVIHRDVLSQYDVCPERSSDAGSSCCTLFASTLATHVLTASSHGMQEKALRMPAVQVMLQECVRKWDADYGLDGQAAASTLEQVVRLRVQARSQSGND